VWACRMASGREDAADFLHGSDEKLAQIRRKSGDAKIILEMFGS